VSGGSPGAAQSSRAAVDSPAATKAARRRQRSRGARPPKRGGASGFGALLPAGERPPPPWHPLPLSEILILFGALGVVVGFLRAAGASSVNSALSRGGAALIAGLAAVIIGTVEVTLREHLSGYRSHTIILALLPVIVLDAAAVLALAPFGTAARLAMLAADIAVFAFLYKLLRARFLDARRERVFRGR
jgi:hypothetical protein